MYNLVSRVPGGLTALRGILETHINEQGQAALEAQGKDADPRKYVNAILTVHKKYSDLVIDTFTNDVGKCRNAPNCVRFRFNSCHELCIQSVHKVLENHAFFSGLLLPISIIH